MGARDNLPLGQIPDICLSISLSLRRCLSVFLSVSVSLSLCLSISVSCSLCLSVSLVFVSRGGREADEVGMDEAPVGGREHLPRWLLSHPPPHHESCWGFVVEDDA